MKLRSVVFGFSITAAITVLTLIILTVLMYFTNISDSAGNICMYAGTAAAVIAGAFFAARTADGKILFHSLSVGVLFIISLILISLAVNHKVTFNAHFLAVAAGSLLSAFTGAVLGNK